MMARANWMQVIVPRIAVRRRPRPNPPEFVP